MASSVSSPSSSNNAAVRRISQEMKEFTEAEAQMEADPNAFATWAEPLEDDIFEWHFALYGAEGARFISTNASLLLFCFLVSVSRRLCSLPRARERDRERDNARNLGVDLFSRCCVSKSETAGKLTRERLLSFTFCLSHAHVPYKQARRLKAAYTTVGYYFRWITRLNRRTLCS